METRMENEGARLKAPNLGCETIDMKHASLRLRSPAFATALAMLMSLVAACLPPAFAAPPPENSAADPFAHGRLFRVDAPGKPSSYVFGTVHSNDPRVARMTPEIEAALADSRRFAPEILLDVSEQEEFFAAAQFDDARRLGDYFSADMLSRIRVALGVNAPASGVFERLKPWAVLLMLAQPERVGSAETLDEILVDAARRRRMTIIGLELPEEQTATLDAIPVSSQVALVRWALDRREALVTDNEAAIQAWLAGDLGLLAAQARAPGEADPAMAPHFAQLTKYVIEGRSALMAHRLFLPLREGRVFVAVGALHLHGPKGLLALIRAQGYRVRRIDRVRRRPVRDAHA